MNTQKDWEKQLSEIATKYNCGDKVNEPFFREMFTTFLALKKRTGKDPHEWLKHFATEVYEGTGAIGWNDALNAIEAVTKKYEAILADARREVIAKIEKMKHNLNANIETKDIETQKICNRLEGYNLAIDDVLATLKEEEGK